MSKKLVLAALVAVLALGASIAQAKVKTSPETKGDAVLTTPSPDMGVTWLHKTAPEAAFNRPELLRRIVEVTGIVSKSKNAESMGISQGAGHISPHLVVIFQPQSEKEKPIAVAETEFS